MTGLRLSSSSSARSRDLALGDSQAGKNRTVFKVAAAVARARALKRERMDAEIIATLSANEEADFAVYTEWECTLGDGLEDVD